MKAALKLISLLLALALLGGVPAAWAEDSSYFTSRDLNQTYDAGKAVRIVLGGDSASCESASVSVLDTAVTISAEGIYVLSGTLANGQIIVDAPKDAKVQLVLSGADIHCETSAAIYVRQADKVFITLDAGTQNTLSCGETFEAIDESNIDAALFSKDTLTINGSGSLTVLSSGGHGIVSKGKLKITGGDVRVTAVNHGITAKNGVYMADGTLNITAGQDGLRAENAEETDRGLIVISGGSIQISADGDGIYASGNIEISGGDFTVTTGGGSAEAASDQEDRGGWDRGGWGSSSGSSQDSISTKGLKSDGIMSLSGGNYVLDCLDDAVHGSANVVISGGTYRITTGDDGVHADTDVLISGGTITIAQSYEGIEGQRIEISGGSIDITASDDGMNAAGGDDESQFGFFESSDSNEIIISGGCTVINADGDGLDSNGDFTVTGGELYVSGPENSGNGALDFNGTGTITGGIVIAAGASGMAQNFGSTSTQGAMLVSCSGQSGTVVTLLDEDGNELISWTGRKRFSSIVISMPNIQSDSTYTLTAGTFSQTITMNGLIYGSGFGFGGGGFSGFGGGGGHRP